LVQYRRNQNLLMEVPSLMRSDFIQDRAKAQAVVSAALAEGRQMLSEPEAKTILAAYGIPVVETRIANTIEDAVQSAQKIGFPVAVKILSPDITHKSDVGGVVLDLETDEAVRMAATAMHKRLHEIKPDARLQGFSVQAMARRPDAHELIVGVTTDPVFGPIILFGQGGVAVEVTADHAVSLPPLNMVLARDLISRTRVCKLLAGYRNRAPADIDAICRVLIQVSHLVADIAEIAELDINPLLADSRGVIALDARLRVATPASATAGVDRFAIRPYPEEWEKWITWQRKPLLLRPIKPEDGPEHVAFFNALDPEDVRYRMFIRIRELQPSQLARLTQVDYDREMAFIATREREQGGWETLGVARAVTDPDNVSAEFAIIVRSDLKGQGLGKILMTRLIDYCRNRGTQRLEGEALSQNRPVLHLASQLGFKISPAAEAGTTFMRLDLAPH
jgi:acetyltransferase